MMCTVIAAVLMAAAGELPDLVVDRDDVRVERSCRIVIPAGKVIADANGDGVLHVAAPDIVIEFADGAVLRGAAADTRPDEYRGYGIRIDGERGVTLRNARVSGYWCGVYATKADGLTIERCDASDNRRAHLGSTPAAEDSGDWLSPHRNDANEWLTNYGAAIYIEDSSGVTVRGCHVRDGQNALCLDRVEDAKIYDNDFSFNSGWGIALWRSSRNVITRNALDFCVRGYSHGVYNRGQDSAGVLMFEQCNENIVAENSATHGGDGFFGFGGREALGEMGEHPADWYVGRGNSRNVLIRNDFSYAPAHGIEMTFSFGNIFYGNRLVDNAICGVWGGYSQETLIARNEIADNGAMGYGLERGGVNIEHSRGNRIVQNEFARNKCGVHLWWDPDPGFAKLPWAQANNTDTEHNWIAENRFEGGEVAVHLRLVRDAEQPQRGKCAAMLAGNDFIDVGARIKVDAGVQVQERSKLDIDPIDEPQYPVYGEARPVAARPHLRGRQNIIMTAWGPWDHERPLARRIESGGGADVWELRKFPEGTGVTLEGQGVKLTSESPAPGVDTHRVAAEGPGVRPYALVVSGGGQRRVLRGTLIAAEWEARFFKWDKARDPRENPAAWRALAEGADAQRAKLDRLRLKYGHDGPSAQLPSEPQAPARGQRPSEPQAPARGQRPSEPQAPARGSVGSDYFGMIARTRLPLPAGTWRFVTTSDDGVRVLVDGEPVIENWTWHGPTRDVGELKLEQDAEVEIVVEHFEIDGFAVLELEIEQGR